jgi:hypothetical protein
VKKRMRFWVLMETGRSLAKNKNGARGVFVDALYDRWKGESSSCHAGMRYVEFIDSIINVVVSLRNVRRTLGRRSLTLPCILIIRRQILHLHSDCSRLANCPRLQQQSPHR